MSKRVLSLLLCLVVVCVCICWQYHNQVKLDKAVRHTLSLNRNMAKYISNSFVASWHSEEEKIISQLMEEIDSSSYYVYLPAGLCRACFTSLLFAFQDNQIDFSKISVFSERLEIEVKSECLSQGAHYAVRNTGVDGIEDIIIVRLYQGYLPLAMKYNLEREYELQLFLSDNSPFIASQKNYD